MNYAMEQEDFVRMKDAEIAALREEIDNLVARIRVLQQREEQARKWKDERDRLLLALDEALGRERARKAIRDQEEAAGLLTILKGESIRKPGRGSLGAATYPPRHNLLSALLASGRIGATQKTRWQQA
jgi:hypothetical protein